jgi:hypothetical protein
VFPAAAERDPAPSREKGQSRPAKVDGFLKFSANGHCLLKLGSFLTQVRSVIILREENHSKIHPMTPFKLLWKNKSESGVATCMVSITSINFQSVQRR